MTAINYHNRIFRALENSATGEVDAATRFHYRQTGDLIWATYAGGAIRFGTLVGTVAADGKLDFSYQHVNHAGRHMRGRCRSTPEHLPDGRLRLHEQWQWLPTPDAPHLDARGESVIEEVVPATISGGVPDDVPDGIPDGIPEVAATPTDPSERATIPATGTAPAIEIQAIPGEFAICRLPAGAPVPDWATAGNWVAITRTEAELSIVCPTSQIPLQITASRGWRALRVAGPLDLSQTGILARLAGPLAQAAIPVFAISTYDTDYLLVPASLVARALACLNNAHNLPPG